ncbi:unnamed protein product [Parajaminaea phylloscopi]
MTADQTNMTVPQLSTRGRAHAASITPFWTVFDTVLRDVHCPQRNPRGIINMGIANNSLMEKELLQYLATHLELDPTDLTYGTSLHGSTRLFAALTKHFNRSVFAPVTPVTSQHLLTGPGCGPLLDQLFEHLADPGEGVLVAAPYYNGFDADLATRSHVRCLPVHSTRGDGSEAEAFSGHGALANFEETMVKYKRDEGVTSRAIIVCNPHNPVGRCYDREALLAYGRFAEKHNLHIVFDEIYALSTFPTSDDASPVSFTSALNIDWEKEAGCHPARIHILTSASKDFGLNGFRLGIFISQHNAELVSAMKVTTKLYMVSSPADALFSCLLTDDDFFPAFVQENQRRLSAAYESMKKWCLKHDIPYTASNAGHFLLIDFSRFLDNSSAGKETDLWTRCFKERVSITPGSNYHHPKVGVFRVTFSMPEAALSEGLQRLERALGLRQTVDASGARVEAPAEKSSAKDSSEAATVTVETLPFRSAAPEPCRESRADWARADERPSNKRGASSRSTSPSFFRGTKGNFWRPSSRSSRPSSPTPVNISRPSSPFKLKPSVLTQLSRGFASTSVAGAGAAAVAGVLDAEESRRRQAEVDRALEHVRLSGKVVGCLC